jgi:hypothetical protein
MCECCDVQALVGDVNEHLGAIKGGEFFLLISDVNLSRRTLLHGVNWLVVSQVALVWLVKLGWVDLVWFGLGRSVGWLVWSGSVVGLLLEFCDIGLKVLNPFSYTTAILKIPAEQTGHHPWVM